MYDFIRGELVERLPTSAVVDCAGVGWKLLITLATYTQLPPSGEVKLFAHLHVQEDDQRLYGFHSRDERQMFRMLRLVSGIGPTTAINILSGMSPEGLRSAIAAQDTAALKRVRGIGKKLAERIVVELKDAFAGVPTSAAAGGTTTAGPAVDAVLALLSLGYARSAAEEAVRKVQAEEGAGLSASDLIRSALRRI